ncbi:unnamed protein product, partial [Prorocentrum cordatum]
QGDPGLVVQHVSRRSVPRSDASGPQPPQRPPKAHAFKQNNAKWLRQQLSGPGNQKTVTKARSSLSGEDRRSVDSADGSGDEGRRQSTGSANSSSESWEEHGAITDAAASSWWTRTRECAAVVAGSRKFDTLVAVIILANSLTIGVEIQWGVDGRDEEDMRFLSGLEDGFIAFYTAEICVRLLASVEKCLNSRWFWMDVVLVSTGIITQWILGWLLEMSEGGLDFVGQVLIVRILRLLRLVRALRTISFFQDLWKLVNGVLGSLRTVLSAMFLLLAFTFVFACISVYLIKKNDRLMDNAETAEIVRERFSSLPMSMLTLLQFSDADSIGEIYGPLIRTDARLLVYFGLVFTLFTIGERSRMNLVTAVIVEHAIECSKLDTEMQQVMMRKRLKKVQPQILEVFRAMDESGNGNISISELKDWQFQKNTLPRDIRDLVMPDALADLFDRGFSGHGQLGGDRPGRVRGRHLAPGPLEQQHRDDTDTAAPARLQKVPAVCRGDHGRRQRPLGLSGPAQE